MNHGMHARENPGTDVRFFLVGERFDLITRALGARSEADRAALLGVDPKTIYRARRGPVGEGFAAKALAVMRQHEAELRAIGITPCFEAMFEVRKWKEVAA